MTVDSNLLAAEVQPSVWPSFNVLKFEEGGKTQAELSMNPGAKEELGTVAPGC